MKVTCLSCQARENGGHCGLCNNRSLLAQLVFEVVAVLLLTRLVEPVYGSKEFLKFLFIVDLSVNACVLAGAYLVFALGQDAEGDIL